MIKVIAKISLGFLLMCAAIGGFLVYALLGVVEEFSAPAYSISLTPKPELSAQSWIVFDVELGDTLFSHNPDDVRPIASVTKLVSAASFYARNNLTTTTRIVWSDVVTDGEAGKLSSGEVYSYRELLFPLLLESSNDAAEALARNDDTLIDAMNSYVADIGLSHTSFSDASGLSVQDVSTARELKALVRHLLSTAPHILDITQLPAYFSEDNGWYNNNPFVTDAAYRGGKHGFTYDASRTAVALFDENISGGSVRTIGYVLLGSDDLDADMELVRAYTVQNTTYR